MEDAAKLTRAATDPLRDIPIRERSRFGVHGPLCRTIWNAPSARRPTLDAAATDV
jgi:hypothetical protein